MTRDEIVTVLRCCAEGECHGCIIYNDKQSCQERALDAAADLIDNQQRHIEALMKANDSLKDAIARRDKQIEDMNQGMAQLAKAVAVKEDTGYTPEEIAKLQGDLIQRNAELLKAREELRGAKNTAEQYAAINETLFDSNMKLGADRKALINELCQYCGKYKKAHEGACDGCKWRDI